MPQGARLGDPRSLELPFSRMRAEWVCVLVAAVVLTLACSGSEDPPSSRTSGGASGTGAAAGGALGTSGGIGAGGGGTTGSGGMAATGGTAGSSGATGSAGAAGSGGTGGSVTDLPIILSFSAEPPNLPNGGGMTTLNWKVSNADTLAIDQGVGSVSGESRGVTVTGTTIFTLTATNGNGSVTASTAVVAGQNPARDGGRYVAMVSPNDGESFLAPSSLRLVAAGRDPNVYTNSPRDGNCELTEGEAVCAEADRARPAANAKPAPSLKNPRRCKLHKQNMSPPPSAHEMAGILGQHVLRHAMIPCVRRPAGADRTLFSAPKCFVTPRTAILVLTRGSAILPALCRGGPRRAP